MSPFFAFMPYVKPLWQLPMLIGVSVEVQKKLSDLREKMKSSIVLDGSKVGACF